MPPPSALTKVTLEGTSSVVAAATAAARRLAEEEAGLLSRFISDGGAIVRFASPIELTRR